MNGVVVTKGISREFDCTPQVRYNMAVVILLNYLKTKECLIIVKLKD